MSVHWTMEAVNTSVSTLMEATTAHVTLAMICKMHSPVKVKNLMYILHGRSLKKIVCTETIKIPTCSVNSFE